MAWPHMPWARSKPDLLAQTCSRPSWRRLRQPELSSRHAARAKVVGQSHQAAGARPEPSQEREGEQSRPNLDQCCRRVRNRHGQEGQEEEGGAAAARAGERGGACASFGCAGCAGRRRLLRALVAGHAAQAQLRGAAARGRDRRDAANQVRGLCLRARAPQPRDGGAAAPAGRAARDQEGQGRPDGQVRGDPGAGR